MKHEKDYDCSVGPDNCCKVCGVHHGDPCPKCAARGFHSDDCADGAKKKGAMASYEMGMKRLEIKEAIRIIAERSGCAKQLLSDPELCGMLGLTLDHKRIKQCIKRWTEQIDVLETERASLASPHLPSIAESKPRPAR